MPTKWKNLTGKLWDISCSKMEPFNWRAERYFMSMKWKTLAGELYNISCPGSSKV